VKSQQCQHQIQIKMKFQLVYLSLALFTVQAAPFDSVDNELKLAAVEAKIDKITEALGGYIVADISRGICYNYHEKNAISTFIGKFSPFNSALCLKKCKQQPGNVRGCSFNMSTGNCRVYHGDISGAYDDKRKCDRCKCWRLVKIE